MREVGLFFAVYDVYEVIQYFLYGCDARSMFIAFWLLLYIPLYTLSPFYIIMYAA